MQWGQDTTLPSRGLRRRPVGKSSESLRMTAWVQKQSGSGRSLGCRQSFRIGRRYGRRACERPALPTRDLVAGEAGLHGWTGRRVGEAPTFYGRPVTHNEGGVTHNEGSKTRAKNARFDAIRLRRACSAVRRHRICSVDRVGHLKSVASITPMLRRSVRLG